MSSLKKKTQRSDDRIKSSLVQLMLGSPLVDRCIGNLCITDPREDPKESLVLYKQNVKILKNFLKRKIMNTLTYLESC